MDNNGLFQNQQNQTFGNMSTYGGNYWGNQNNNLINQQPYYTPYINRTQQQNQTSNIPVRVIFSPEQIAPQEIPTSGTPALFPLSDGSRIIAKKLLPNGLFDETIYVLQPKNQNGQPVQTEFEQLMLRLNGIEDSLNRVLSDLYGTKNQNTQEGDANKNG